MTEPKPPRPLSAIDRVLATIPDEIRYRVPGERRDLEPDKPAQQSLFDSPPCVLDDRSTPG